MLILQKGDYVKIVGESPYSPIKVGARGLVLETYLKPHWDDYHIALIRFKLAGEYINLETGSNRMAVVGHKKETDEEILPDAEAVIHDEIEEIKASE